MDTSIIDKSDLPALTPAAQMRKIRETVRVDHSQSTEEATRMLSGYFARLDVLRARIADLERKMTIVEKPFRSPAPIIGPLIVTLRNAWNWMSTKWYVLPLLQQQNDFNKVVAQTLRELVTSIESTTQAIKELQTQIDVQGADDHQKRSRDQ